MGEEKLFIAGRRKRDKSSWAGLSRGLCPSTRQPVQEDRSSGATPHEPHHFAARTIHNAHLVGSHGAAATIRPGAGGILYSHCAVAAGRRAIACSRGSSGSVAALVLQAKPRNGVSAPRGGHPFRLSLLRTPEWDASCTTHAWPCQTSANRAPAQPPARAPITGARVWRRSNATGLSPVAWWRKRPSRSPSSSRASTFIWPWRGPRATPSSTPSQR